jgi:hypothetical protein
MLIQRLWSAENRGENKLSKWTVEGAVKGVGQVFCDVWAYVSCREYVGTSLRAQVQICESRWQRG